MGRDDSNADRYRYPYEPTPYSVLERLANAGYMRKGNTLLDYGCGKGRVDFFLFLSDEMCIYRNWIWWTDIWKGSRESYVSSVFRQGDIWISECGILSGAGVGRLCLLFLTIFSRDTSESHCTDPGVILCMSKIHAVIFLLSIRWVYRIPDDSRRVVICRWNRLSWSFSWGWSEGADCGIWNLIKNKGYGANHTLLWQARETSSVKLLFFLASSAKNTWKQVCKTMMIYLHYTHLCEYV